MSIIRILVLLFLLVGGCSGLPGNDNSAADTVNHRQDVFDSGADLNHGNDTTDRDGIDANSDGDPGVDSSTLPDIQPLDPGLRPDGAMELPTDTMEPSDLNSLDIQETTTADVASDIDTIDDHGTDPGDSGCTHDCLPGCGDGDCDAEGGETVDNCWQDCWIDVCTLQMGPTCIPSDCERMDGSPGKCGSDATDGCTCGPRYGTCETDSDCLGRTWPIRCLGHWNCVAGECDAACGEPCGDEVCDAAAGEDSTTCSSDCKVRDAHCDDGTEPICDRVPPVCTEFEIMAYQDSCYVCVNALTCKPWGEAGCKADPDCKSSEWCNPCATSGCPLCENCVAACVAHGCATEEYASCFMYRPLCDDGMVAVVRDLCWVCVDMLTCEPRPG